MKGLLSVFFASNLLIASKAIASYSITDNFFIRAHIGAQVWHNNYETLVNVPVAATPEITTIEVQDDKNTGVTAITGLGGGYGFNRDIAMTLDYINTKINDIPANNIALGFMFRM